MCIDTRAFAFEPVRRWNIRIELAMCSAQQRLRPVGAQRYLVINSVD